MSSIKAITKSLGLLTEKVIDSTEGFLKTAKGLVKVKEEKGVTPQQTPKNPDKLAEDKDLDSRSIEAPQKMSPRERRRKKLEQAAKRSLSETPTPPETKEHDAAGTIATSPLPSLQQPKEKPVPAPRKKRPVPAPRKKRPVPAPRTRFLSLKSLTPQQPVPDKEISSTSDPLPPNNAVKDSLLERCEHLVTQVKDLNEFSRTGDSIHGEEFEEMAALHNRLCFNPSPDDALIAQSKTNTQYWRGRARLRPAQRLKDNVSDNASKAARAMAESGSEAVSEAVNRAKYGYRPLNPRHNKTHKKIKYPKIDPVVAKVQEEIENADKLVEKLERELEASPNQRYLRAKKAFNDKLEHYQLKKELLAEKHLLQQQLESAKNTLFEQLNIQGHNGYGLVAGLNHEYIPALEAAIRTINMSDIRAVMHLRAIKNQTIRRLAEKLSSTFRRYSNEVLEDKSFRLEMKDHLDTLNAQQQFLKDSQEHAQSEYEALKKELAQAADTLASETETYMTSEQCIDVIAQRKKLEAAREIQENFNRVYDIVAFFASHKRPGKTLAELAGKERKYNSQINKSNLVDDEVRELVNKNQQELNSFREGMKLYYLVGTQYDVFPKKNKKNKKNKKSKK